MRTRLTKLVAALAALAALAIGGSALASAAGDGSQPAKVPAASQPQGAAAGDPVETGDTDSIEDENGRDDATEAAGEAEDGDQSPAYRSSVTAPEQEFGSEEAEADALRSKATVSAAAARSAALAAVPGTVEQVELDNENGNVVYSVEIRKADGTALDVKIDAGTAKVLQQDADDGDEAPEPGN
jgi:uncharacterized membrane protein YkoI